MAFHIGVEAQHFENKARDIVEIQFFVAHDLVILFGKHGFKVRHELFGLYANGILGNDVLVMESTCQIAKAAKFGLTYYFSFRGMFFCFFACQW